MKIKSTFRLSYLLIFALLFLQSCKDDKSSFGEDLETLIVPTEVSYPEILNAREFGYMETSTPFVNANGHPVFFDLVSITKDGETLDESYKNSVTMLGFTTKEVLQPDTGHVVKITDLTDNGKIIIKEGNPFGNGDYYFTIKASVVINGEWAFAIFEDALHLNVGPELVQGISYCPNKINFVSGLSTTSDPAEVFGGNPDFRFELGSATDKLTIDPITGVLSLNTSYVISETEYVEPTINVISNVSEEIASFDGVFTAVLSSSAITLEKDTNYFFYPQLKPTNNNNTAVGGIGYSVEMSAFASKPGWVKKNIYKATPPARQLKSPEILQTRDEASVSGINGLNVNYWGPLNNPWETWAIMDPVNLTQYKGCYNTKLEFWVFQGFSADILNLFEGKDTPVAFEVQITDSYTGDVYGTNWTQINDVLTCKIDGETEEFVGTPYPLSGSLDPSKNATGKWVKCELDLADYGDITSFTIAFRSKTSYGENISINLRGELFISDVHFVAKEK